MMISVVPKSVVDIVWDDAERLLKPAVDTSVGKLEVKHIREGIEKDIYVLWAVMDADKMIAAIATRVIQYPSRKALALEWIGGSRMSEWFDMAHDTFVEFAKSNNCQHLEGYGRKAWGRVLNKRGWKPEYTAYRMDL